MTVTDPFPPAPAYNDWDLDALKSAALAVLRLQVTDVDNNRVRLAVGQATELIDGFMDLIDPITITEQGEPSLFSAGVQLSVEIYRRKDAPFGVAGGWSTDAVPVFLSADVLKSIYALVRNRKERWGIA